jgi:hypothetical protein
VCALSQPPAAAPDDTWAVARKALDAATSDPLLGGLPAAMQRVCRAACASVALDGAAVQLMTDPRSGSVLASSDEVSGRTAEAAFEAGEGPSLDAFVTARPVLVPDLAIEGIGRWPGFVSLVAERGVSACFSFPLQVGAVRLGVLDLYRCRAGALSDHEGALALVFAEVARDNLLDPPRLSPVEALDVHLSRALATHAEIHQAQGMVTVDLDVGLDEAMALMRSHAFGRNVPLLELAQSILAGERLSRPQDEPS